MVSLCDRYLKRHANVKTCITWLMEAVRRGSEEQCTRFLQLVLRSFNAIKDTQAFMELDIEILLTLLESHQLQTVSEHSVLMAALRWVGYDPESRKYHLPEILYRVRFNLLDEKDLKRLVADQHEFRPFLGDMDKFLTVEMVRGVGDIPRHSVIKWGILVDVPINEIREAGWRLAYGEPYRTHTTMDDLEAIEGDFVLVGASHKGEYKLSLCAMGRRERILNRVAQDKVTFENGAYWYFRPGKAFGFAPNRDVELCAGDTVDEGGEKRLSWIMSGLSSGPGEGGSRAGMEKHLEDSVEWVKLIFTLSV